MNARDLGRGRLFKDLSCTCRRCACAPGAGDQFSDQSDEQQFSTVTFHSGSKCPHLSSLIAEREIQISGIPDPLKVETVFGLKN